MQSSSFAYPPAASGGPVYGSNPQQQMGMNPAQLAFFQQQAQQQQQHGGVPPGMQQQRQQQPSSSSPSMMYQQHQQSQQQGQQRSTFPSYPQTGAGAAGATNQLQQLQQFQAIALQQQQARAMNLGGQAQGQGGMYGGQALPQGQHGAGGMGGHYNMAQQQQQQHQQQQHQLHLQQQQRAAQQHQLQQQQVHAAKVQQEREAQLAAEQKALKKKEKARAQAQAMAHHLAQINMPILSDEQPISDDLERVTERDLAVRRYQTNHDLMELILGPLPLSRIPPLPAVAAPAYTIAELEASLAAVEAENAELERSLHLSVDEVRRTFASLPPPLPSPGQPSSSESIVEDSSPQEPETNEEVAALEVDEKEVNEKAEPDTVPAGEPGSPKEAGSPEGLIQMI